MLILDVGTNVYLIGNCRCLRDHTNEVFLRDSTSMIELTGWEKVCPVLGCFGQILISSLQFTLS